MDSLSFPGPAHIANTSLLECAGCSLFILCNSRFLPCSLADNAVEFQYFADAQLDSFFLTAVVPRVNKVLEMSLEKVLHSRYCSMKKKA